MRVGGASDVGRVRTINEDAFWFDDRLLIVADGMGGHVAGEVAAAVALETVKEAIGSLRLQPGAPVQELVRSAVREANRRVFERARRDGLDGMGTTLTMAVVVDRVAYVGHVGDSRAYHIQKERMVQITEDHSVVAELVKTGGISAAEAHTHPYRNLLTRALGTTPDVVADLYSVSLDPGEGLLLCTDGLTAVLTDEEIYRVLEQCRDPDACARRLVDLANARGGPDNITAVVALVEES